MLNYCKKCGRIVLFLFDKDEKICDCCKSQTYPVPEKYWLDGLDFLISNENEELLREELVKTSPEFDQYLFDHRDKILAKQSAEFNAKLERGRAILEGRDKGNPYGVACPYCKATNVRKISAVSRVVSTGFFGLGSKKMGKQWHCDKCNSDF